MYRVLVGARSRGMLNTRLLLSFIFVNRKGTDKCYNNKRLTSPVEIVNDKKLKEKQIDIISTISKHTNLI